MLRRRPQKQVENNKSLAKPAEKRCVAKLLEQDIANTPRGEKKKARTMQQTVQKILHDHFPGFSDEELFVNKINDATCADKLMEDKQRVERGEKVIMGKLYYESMRRCYRTVDNPLKKLRIDDEKVLMDEQLMDALEPLLDTKRDVSPILLWTEVVGDVNQTTFCGLCRQLCSCSLG